MKIEKTYCFSYEVYGNDGEVRKEGVTECSILEFSEFVVNMAEFGYSVGYEKYPTIEEVIASFN